MELLMAERCIIRGLKLEEIIQLIQVLRIFRGLRGTPCNFRNLTVNPEISEIYVESVVQCRGYERGSRSDRRREFSHL